MENKCPFCNPQGLVAKESKYCRLIVNINQSKGAYAFMVIPKRHVEFIKDLSPEEKKEFRDFWFDCYDEIQTKFGNRKLGNILLNEGKHAGQNVPHIHGHIFVRSEEDDITNMARPTRYVINQEEINTLREKVI